MAWSAGAEYKRSANWNARRPDGIGGLLGRAPGCSVCMQTVEQCLNLLEQPWDGVHLDHDLGGEVLVDHERADCGMAIVRRLCEEPRPHLRDTRFIFILPRQVSSACCCILTRRASEGSASEPALARRKICEI